MNVTQKTDNIAEIKKEKAIVLNEEDTEILANVNMPFANILGEQINGLSEQSIIDIDFNYDTISMDYVDAMFFVNMANEGRFSVSVTPEGAIQGVIQTQIAQTEATQKTVEVTNKITELIEKAQNTQKPVRISFDNDMSVILKIDKHGKITAEFIPGSLEVENYLRNNIASLRQKFDEQNLPYNDLLYRQSKRQNKERGER